MNSILFIAAMTGLATSALALNFETEARLKMAHQIAREQNNADLVERVKKAAASIQAGVDAAETERLLREAESSVGIDPGGWSMAGQPLFHPSPERLAGSESLKPKLEAALRDGSVDGVKATVAEWLSVLGEQAGFPDGRRPGARPGSLTIDEAGATRLFVDAMKSEGRAVRELTAGRPLPDQMLRFYAYVLDGIVTMRPSVERHAASDLAALDALARGIASILLKLQQPEGHFPFPDLRGRNIRFGEMIEKQLAAGAVEVREGWVVTADPNGGSQFDTGVCGVALLRAGATYGESGWTAAGLRAADWALGQACVANFNYNAFSVSLLARAHKSSGRAEYFDGALAKFRLGVAPGQAPNGRWIDPHNARTVYHVIILRSLGDLLDVLTTDREKEITEVKAVAAPALEVLLKEFAAMGITVECLPELLAIAPHFPSHENLPEALDTVAASLVEKCTDGTRVKMGSQPHQLAAVAGMVRD